MMKNVKYILLALLLTPAMSYAVDEPREQVCGACFNFEVGDGKLQSTFTTCGKDEKRVSVLKREIKDGDPEGEIQIGQTYNVSCD
tara:strand:+ start:3272 stop:3526 length:255 start_codon:yes stop_codon:yes gene_type:complete